MKNKLLKTKDGKTPAIGKKKWTKKQLAKALEEFPKWGAIQVDSDKEYQEEMDSRNPEKTY